MAQVDRAPVHVGQTPVVEHLQEDVPDVLVGFLELIEQEHRERLLPDGGDQRRGIFASARVAEQPLQALGGLELAHIESNEPVRRAEEELAESLRDLGLAGAGGADEEEDAERPGRVGQPGFHERNPVDEAFDRLRLAEHAAFEERAHVVEAERRPRIEHVQRQPRRGAERRDHGLRRHLGRKPARDALEHELQQAQQVPRRGRSRQVVRRQVERLGERVVVDVDAVVPRPGSRDRERVLIRHRCQPDHLEDPRHPLPALGQQLVGGGSISAMTAMSRASIAGSMASSRPRGLRECCPE